MDKNIPFGDFRKAIEDAEMRFIDREEDRARETLKELSESIRESIGDKSLSEIREDLIYLCEDNVVMKKEIQRYFKNGCEIKY